MKNLIYLFVMALMAISCGKENTTPSDPTPAPQPEEKDYITISSGTDTAPVFPPEGGDYTISFSTNKPWTIAVSSSAAWCTVAPTSGNAGNSSITITVVENTTTKTLNTEITLNAGTASQIFYIQQNKVTGNEGITVGPVLP